MDGWMGGMEPVVWGGRSSVFVCSKSGFERTGMQQLDERAAASTGACHRQQQAAAYQRGEQGRLLQHVRLVPLHAKASNVGQRGLCRSHTSRCSGRDMRCGRQVHAGGSEGHCYAGQLH